MIANHLVILDEKTHVYKQIMHLWRHKLTTHDDARKE